MAVKQISWSLLSLMAFLSNSMSPNLVRAGFQTVEQGVVRIDLERRMVGRYGNIQLEDTVDLDKMMIDTNESVEAETDLLIESDETNYSLLREQQRRMVGKSIKQEQATSLAQSSQQSTESNLNNN